MLTTPEQRAQWAKLDKEATPEPWGTRPCSGGGLVVLRGEPLGCHAHPQSHLQIFPEKDGESIAAYRSAVPSLLADVEELQDSLETAERNLSKVGTARDQFRSAADTFAKCRNAAEKDRDAARAQVERLTGVLRRVYDSPHEADKWAKEVRDVLGLPIKSCHERKAELDAKRDAEGQVERLTALLREAKQPHYYCEDPWYSCPKATDGCADESKGTECDCGADEFNARIEKELHD